MRQSVSHVEWGRRRSRSGTARLCRIASTFAGLTPKASPVRPAPSRQSPSSTSKGQSSLDFHIAASRWSFAVCYASGGAFDDNVEPGSELMVPVVRTHRALLRGFLLSARERRRRIGGPHRARWPATASRAVDHRVAPSTARTARRPTIRRPLQSTAAPEAPGELNPAFNWALGSISGIGVPALQNRGLVRAQDRQPGRAFAARQRPLRARGSVAQSPKAAEH
jgi:hypothetical protein